MVDPWDSVPGWYDWADHYRKVVDLAPNGATLVEVGVFCGRSLVDLARLAKASGKRLRIVGVDTFRGSEEHLGMSGELHGKPPGTLVGNCMDSLVGCGVSDDVTLMVTTSVNAATFFKDRSLFSVFIDAAHDEENVRADIAAWMPKVTTGGFLAGHDYGTFPDVTMVVNEVLPDAIPKNGESYWSMIVDHSRKAVAA